jgi:serine/threonine protein kinase
MADFAPKDPFDADGGVTVDTLTRGTRLGRYELLLPVATGGMAKVWAARQHGHRGFTKLVAIKTILPHLSNDPMFEKMFLDEARIAACVHHPNVCDIYELGEEWQVLYLAMEWVNGDSLVRVLRASGQLTPIDPRLAARIAADACAGLHAAHEQVDDEGRPLGIVHRDVSPHNVLITADGIVKVTDFGVAKAMGQMHDETAAGQLKGKLHYMAPEQVSGTHIDRRTDVFAMGSLLFEMATGHHPFRGRTDHETMNNIVAGNCTLPSDVVSSFPLELEAIIVRALSNQPVGRFATADRFRQALEEWLAMSGPMVPHSHVQALVRGRLGARLDQRRDRIRAAMATTGAGEDASRSGSTPPPSMAARSNSGVVAASASGRTASTRPRAPSIPDAGGEGRPDPVPDVRETNPPVPHEGGPSSALLEPSLSRVAQGTLAPEVAWGSRARQYVLAGAIGVAVAGVIGVSAWLLFRSANPPVDPEVTGPSYEPTAGIGGGLPALPSGSPVGSVAPQKPAPEDAPILFRVVPESAALFVDGERLADGVRSIPRVAPGRVETVIARAAGYEEEAISLDDTVSGRVDVVLTPSTPTSQVSEPDGAAAVVPTPASATSSK